MGYLKETVVLYVNNKAEVSVVGSNIIKKNGGRKELEVTTGRLSINVINLPEFVKIINQAKR